MKNYSKAISTAPAVNDQLPEDSDISSDASESVPELDDGRLLLRSDSRLFKTLSKIYSHRKELEKESTTSSSTELPPIYSKGPPFTIKLNICIQVVGSRGDVQPFVALAAELVRHGHRVRLATHNVFQEFVRSAGLEFFPVGGDPVELMAYMVKNPGLIPSLRSLKAGDIQKKRKMVAEMLDGFWAACIAPDPWSNQPFVADAIIANPPSFAHIHCAEALGVPVHMMFTMPWTSTAAFPHPLVSLNLKDSSLSPRLANYLSYMAVGWLTWQGLSDVINAWRRTTLDLDPLPHTEGPMLAEALQIPFTYCWSPALVPKPDDWPAYIDICGFFFRAEPEYSPETTLDQFLSSGPPPIYIGFGSIVIDDPSSLTKILTSAIKETGVRAVISRGWSQLGNNEDQKTVDEADAQILYIGDCPHEWLFKRVAMVIHHGGAGTTACGLLNKRPTVVVPFFGDQPFWGEMVAAAGVGPAPIPHKKLNSENLAEAIRFCLSNAAQTAACRIATRMGAEYGVQDAVESFHAHLPATAMRCDLVPDQPACWKLKGKQSIRLSKIATEILLQAAEITPKQLERYESKPLDIQNRRWDVVTATASSLTETGIGMVSSTTKIISKPVEAIVEASRKRKLEYSAGRSASESAPVNTSGNGLQCTKLEGKDGNGASDPVHGTFVKAVSGSVGGVGGFFHHFSKGMLVDLPMAATEGLRAVPRLYGSPVPDHGKVKDWKSGAIVAGKNFSYGLATGMTDLVTEPMKGAKEHGASGAVLGVGKGVLNMTTKVSSGVLGLVAYPGQGLMKSIISSIKGDARRQIAEAVLAEAEYQHYHHNEISINSNQVIQRFREKMAESYWQLQR